MAIAEGIYWGAVGLVAMCVVLGTLCKHISESHKFKNATSHTTEPQVRWNHKSGKAKREKRRQSGRARSQRKLGKQWSGGATSLVRTGKATAKESYKPQAKTGPGNSKSETKKSQ